MCLYVSKGLPLSSLTASSVFVVVRYCRFVDVRLHVYARLYSSIYGSIDYTRIHISLTL